MKWKTRNTPELMKCKNKTEEILILILFLSLIHAKSLKIIYDLVCVTFLIHYNQFK